jgi:hypothetical protein
MSSRPPTDLSRQEQRSGAALFRPIVTNRRPTLEEIQWRY